MPIGADVAAPYPAIITAICLGHNWCWVSTWRRRPRVEVISGGGAVGA
jgi:hypothetical protein